eukprot:4551124-Pyramimonas_sp.AAC.1
MAPPSSTTPTGSGTPSASAGTSYTWQEGVRRGSGGGQEEVRVGSGGGRERVRKGFIGQV